MFEWKLQKSWDEYIRDFGLGRIALWVSFFEAFVLFLCLIFFNRLALEPILIILLSFSMVSLSNMMTNFSRSTIFFINAVYLTICVIFNYVFLGTIDLISGGLERKDYFFKEFDENVFGMPIANFIYDHSLFLGSLQSAYYDFLQLSYLSYFLFPFLGGYFYFNQLSKNNKYKVGRFFGSIGTFFFLNYLLYVIVPVTGPQYYIPELLTLKLPLGSFGTFLNNLVRDSHPNFIDCFPSGHTGISVLVTIWMFKIKNHYRYIFLIFCLGMIQATLALKYHYTLDVLAALPFAVFCYRYGSYIVPAQIDIRKNRKWRY